MLKTLDVGATYVNGLVRPKRKLPFRNHAPLRLLISLPSTPVSRTRGIIRVSPRTARAIIAGDEADFYRA